MPRAQSFNPGDFAQVVVRHLAEIGAGRCSITDESISAQADDSMREVLIGLLMLHEDLQLERRLNQKATDEGQQLLGRLREALTGRDNFLLMAAHELRTPLTTLRIDTEFFKRVVEVATAPDDSSARALARVERQVRRLGRLVEEVLDVAQISGNRLQLRPERLDLTQLAAEVVERFAPQSAHLQLDCPAPLWGVWDGLRVDQVLTNLLTNATRHGLGRPIEVTVGRKDSRVALAVRDHGVGIPATEQDRIFERFTQAGLSRQSSGLGLGLWIVRSLVTAMRGEVSVASAPDEGATFTVLLPLE